MSANEACPCLHTTPCNPRCTCIDAGSSVGCRRCCSYGSPAQQATAAIRIARAIDKPYEVAVEQELEKATGSFSTMETPADVIEKSLAENPQLQKMFVSGPHYRTSAGPAQESVSSEACADCGAVVWQPLCGICERKRMVAELEVLRRFKDYALYEGDEPKMRERFRQESGMELP